MYNKDYKELLVVIQQMISDNVQLVHGGQIIDWTDTKIPELLQKIKNDNQISQDITIDSSVN